MSGLEIISKVKNMRQLRVRFLLKSSLYIDILLSEASARKYVQDWGRGHLKGRLDGVDDTGTSWAVDTESIQAMHTYDPIAVQQAQEQLLMQQQRAQTTSAVGWGGKIGSG